MNLLRPLGIIPEHEAEDAGVGLMLQEDIIGAICCTFVSFLPLWQAGSGFPAFIWGSQQVGRLEQVGLKRVLYHVKNLSVFPLKIQSAN